MFDTLGNVYGAMFGLFAVVLVWGTVRALIAYVRRSGDKKKD